MEDSYLDTQQLAKHIEFGIWIVVLLRKFMMFNLMKPRVHKKRMRTWKMLEAFNFQMPWRIWMLVNWGLGEWMMMKMIKYKCSLTQMCKMIQIKLVQVALITMNKIKWLVHHLNPIIKQVQAIKFQSSNQPILQEIIHWTLSLVIFQEVCIQDQDWSSFDSEVIGLHWFSFLWLIGSFLDKAV